MPSHFQSRNCSCRSSGLVCCSGWAQLGNECLTRMYQSTSICQPYISCCLLCQLSHVIHLCPLQLSVKATSPVRKMRCVSGQMNVAVVMVISEPAVTLVRAFFCHLLSKQMMHCWYISSTVIQLSHFKIRHEYILYAVGKFTTTVGF